MKTEKHVQLHKDGSVWATGQAADCQALMALFALDPDVLEQLVAHSLAETARRHAIVDLA